MLWVLSGVRRGDSLRDCTRDHIEYFSAWDVVGSIFSPRYARRRLRLGAARKNTHSSIAGDLIKAPLSMTPRR
jgi:hypothetical protein